MELIEKNLSIEDLLAETDGTESYNSEDDSNNDNNNYGIDNDDRVYLNYEELDRSVAQAYNGDDDFNAPTSNIVVHKCSRCELEFPNKSRLRYHSKLHTTSSFCEVCQIKFQSQGAMLLHKRFVHACRKYGHACEVCRAKFRLKQDLVSHYQIHRLPDKETVACTACGNKFISMIILKLHEIIVCSRQTLFENPDAEEFLDGKGVYVQKPIDEITGHHGEGMSCGINVKCFEDNNLSSNTKTHEVDDNNLSLSNCDVYKCEFCDRSFNKKGMHTLHVRTHTRPHICDVCQKGFAKRFSMEAHRKTHFNNKEFRCDSCGKAFTLRNQLTSHVTRLHTELFPNVCQCTASFPTVQQLQNHCRRFCPLLEGNGESDGLKNGGSLIKEEKSKPAEYKCLVCLAQMKMKAHIKRHCKSHLDQQDHVCIKCNLMFHRVSQWMTHKKEGQCIPRSPTPDIDSLYVREKQVKLVKEVAKSEPDIKIELDATETSTTASQEFNKITKGTNCLLCNQDLRRMDNLRRHITRIHNIPAMFPFGCCFCDKFETIGRQEMRKHLDSHLQCKIYGCATCRRRFGNSPAFRTHFTKGRCERNFALENYEEINVENVTLEIVSENPLEKFPKASIYLTAAVDIKNLRINENLNELCIKLEDTTGNGRYLGNGLMHSSNELSIAEDNLFNGLLKTDSNGRENNGSGFGGNGKLICKIRRMGEEGYLVEGGDALFQIKREVEDEVDDFLQSKEYMSGEDYTDKINPPFFIKFIRDKDFNEVVFINDLPYQTWILEALRKSKRNLESDEAREAMRMEQLNWCTMCSLQFSTKYKYKSHMLRHSNNKPFKCEMCARTYRTMSELKAHRKWHVRSKTISCDFCDLKFGSESDRNRHASVHTNIKPHACEVCGKKFRRRVYLITHIRMHTGELPYQCPLCLKAFRLHSSLSDHLKLHDGRKPYECCVCQKRFAQRGNWKTHERRHLGIKNHKCEGCGKGFVQNYELQYHRLRCVSQELPFSCMLCGARFTSPHPLRRHFDRHSCRICNKQFTDMKVKVVHQLECTRQIRLTSLGLDVGAYNDEVKMMEELNGGMQLSKSQRRAITRRMQHRKKKSMVATATDQSFKPSLSNRKKKKVPTATLC